MLKRPVNELNINVSDKQPDGVFISFGAQARNN